MNQTWVLKEAAWPRSAAQAQWVGHAKILLAIVLWLGCTAWLRPLMLPDEGRYASVAWEMVRSGDWLTPTLNGLPFFHKPPLFYWISGAALALTGQTELAARAASLLGASLGAFSLYLFTWRWVGRTLALRALLVLLVQPLFFLGAQFANLDMLVAGCITATILCLAHAALSFETGHKHRTALMCAYVLAALGVLAKGLIGLVLPAMVIGLWLLLRKRGRSLWALISWPGMAIFLLIAGPWFVLMQQRFDGFLHYFFVVQHFQRFASGGFNNVQPFWFYPVVLIACSLPCLLWSKGVMAKSYWRPETSALRDVRLLMALTLLVITVFFTLPQSKLVGYIVPVVPALAWLIADAAGLLKLTGRSRRLWFVSVAVSAFMGMAAVLVLTINQNYSAKSMGEVLMRSAKPDEPVYMLQEYVYDLPFYARLRHPVEVTQDWQKERLSHRDNWRRELLDAGDFAPALAKNLLLPQDSLSLTLCHGHGAWLVGQANAAKTFPFLEQLPPVFSSHGKVLWHVDAQNLPALRCSGLKQMPMS